MADSDNESGGISNSTTGNREQDRFLPIANVSRIMKKALPANAKISKDAKETVQECVSEFISFITGEASDKCQREKRKTINGDDLLWAMTTLGFEEYVEPLKIYLQKFREMEGEKCAGAGGSQSQQKDGGGGGGDGGASSGFSGGVAGMYGGVGGGLMMMGQQMYGSPPSQSYHQQQQQQQGRRKYFHKFNSLKLLHKLFVSLYGSHFTGGCDVKLYLWKINVGCCSSFSCEMRGITRGQLTRTIMDDISFEWEIIFTAG